MFALLAPARGVERQLPVVAAGAEARRGERRLPQQGVLLALVPVEDVEHQSLPGHVLIFVVVCVCC